MWPFSRRSRVAAFGTGWWYNPETDQAITVPGNTDHYKFLNKNLQLFLEPGETPKENRILDHWVQIREYSTGDLVIHFPEPVTGKAFRNTQKWLMGKVEPKRVAIGVHTNIGAVIQKSYFDWLDADSFSQFAHSRRSASMKLSNQYSKVVNSIFGPSKR